MRCALHAIFKKPFCTALYDRFYVNKDANLIILTVYIAKFEQAKSSEKKFLNDRSTEQLLKFEIHNRIINIVKYT